RGHTSSSPRTRAVPLLPALTQTVLNATKAALTSSRNPSISGQSVTFTATVTSSASGTPTGIVSFVDTFGSGSGPIGSAALTNGKAALTISGLAVGSHSIIAAYGGDTNFAGSNSPPVTQTVLP